MKHLFILLFGLTLLCHPVSAQDSSQEETRTVVTAEGTKTVPAEDQNRELKDRLQKMKQDRKDERESKRNQKRIFKIAGRIAILAIILAGVAWWRNRKKKNS